MTRSADDMMNSTKKDIQIGAENNSTCFCISRLKLPFRKRLLMQFGIQCHDHDGAGHDAPQDAVGPRPLYQHSQTPTLTPIMLSVHSSST